VRACVRVFHNFADTPKNVTAVIKKYIPFNSYIDKSFLITIHLHWLCPQCAESFVGILTLVFIIKSKILSHNHRIFCGLGSVVGIATGYRLGGTGIESQWGRDFPHLSRLALGPTHPPLQWVLGLSRG